MPLIANIAARLHQGVARRVLLSCACALLLATSAARAQSAAPAPGPVFTPGQYEAETHYLAHPDPAVKNTVCLAAPDYAAFRAKIMADYRASPPAFQQECRLDDDPPVANGFTLSIQCKILKVVFTWEFQKDEVRLTSLIQTGNAIRPTPTDITVLRRVGDCAAPK